VIPLKAIKIFTLFLLLSLVSSVNAFSVTIVDNIPGVFMDISGTGTALSLLDDEEVDITTTVGNSLFSAGTVRVGSNGGVRFGGTGQSLSFSNGSIPSLVAFGGDQTLLPFWDDINTASGTNGEIYWQEIGTTLIVQWDNVDFFGGEIDQATFQLQVFGLEDPALAQFLYTDIEGARANGGGSATIGYQDGAVGPNDFQWSFNTAGAVSDGTVLSLIESIPEPSTMLLLGGGLLGLLAFRRKFRK
jgi:hypothetical protein